MSDAVVPVALERCTGYDKPDILKERLLTAAKNSGYAFSQCRGVSVLLKPNLLSPKPPEKNATTHPAFVRAAAELVLDYGGRVTVGESPGMGDTRRCLQACGIDAALAGLPVNTVTFTRSRTVPAPPNAPVREYPLAAEADEYDVLVNLPKIKTHAQMGITAAVKNLFGLVPGLAKARLHLELENRGNAFAEMLAALGEIRRPALTLADGITAMQGNGPGSGEAYPLHLIAAAVDPFALDTVLARVLGFDPDSLPLQQAARHKQYGVTDPDRIRIIGLPEAQAAVRDFRPAAVKTRLTRAPAWLAEPVRKAVQIRPLFDRGLCTACGQCVSICAARALHLKKGRVPIDRARCIHCFCCQEICPEGAIRPGRSRLGRTITAAAGLWNKFSR